MTTELKIVANRRNSQRSTGPRSPGGKRVSRLNAVRHGIFAESPLISGEDPNEYSALVAAAFAKYSPDGVFEQMFLWQAVRDVWRVKRLDLAERTYLEQIRDAVFRRTAKLNSTNFCAAMTARQAARTYQRSLRDEPPEATQATSDAAQQDLQHPEKLGIIFLEANVSADERMPMAELDRRRRVLMRDIRQKVETLQGVQERRAIVEPD